MRRQDLWLGATFIVTGELMFASMGVGIRFVAGELSNESIVFFRNLFGLCLLAPWLLRDGVGGFKTAIPRLHLLRGIAGVSAMYCFFYAIAHMPFADAMLLKLTAPLFIPLVALLWLREQLTSRIWLAIAVGFAGVLLILRPGLQGLSPVALVALLGGLFAAVAKVTVRRLSATEPPLRIVFYFALTATLVSSVPLIWSWQTPSISALGWLLAIALFATIGQLCLTKGLSLAPAARMGAFGYFAVIFGAAYGWLLWNEQLLWWTVAGSLLIFTSCLLAGGRPSRSRRADTARAGRALES
ncbi:MAG: DMT family transporter [Pseudomonadota bacterium]|nr:DMT family transporter [Pseudomonadota bacterium]